MVHLINIRSTCFDFLKNVFGSFYMLKCFDKRNMHSQVLSADSNLHFYQQIKHSAEIFFPTLMFVLCLRVNFTLCE